MITFRLALLCMFVAAGTLHAMDNNESAEHLSLVESDRIIIAVDYTMLHDHIQAIRNAREQRLLRAPTVHTHIRQTSKNLTALLQPYFPKPPEGCERTASAENETLYLAHMHAGLGNVASVVHAMIAEIDLTWPDKTVAPCAQLIASAPHIELCYFTLLKKFAKLLYESHNLTSHFQTVTQALQDFESNESDLDYWIDSGNVSDGESYEDLEFISRYGAFMPSPPN